MYKYNIVGEVRLHFRLKRKHNYYVHFTKRREQANTTLILVGNIRLHVKVDITYIHSSYSDKQLSVCVTDSILSVKLTYSKPVEEEQTDGK